MENYILRIFNNIGVFIAGIAGAYNITIAIRNLKHGTKYEVLLKQNEDYKKEISNLKNEIVGKDAIIKAYADKLKENGRNKK